MRSTRDCITGLGKYITEWGVADEKALKAIDKAAKAEVDQAVIAAKAAPEPDIEKDLWTDIYYKGSEPPYMRGREREEVGRLGRLLASSFLLPLADNVFFPSRSTTTKRRTSRSPSPSM